MKTRAASTVLTGALICVLAVADADAAHQDAGWSIEVLPPLQTPVGELPTVAGQDLNEVGQVAGIAYNTLNVTVYRYTPGEGMLDLDPNGRYRVTMPTSGGMNDRGDVLMFPLGDDGREDILLYTDEGGHRSLQRGKNRRVRTSFQLGPGTSRIPNAGHLCGFVVPPQGGWEPYIFRPDTGWESLRHLHPRFRTAATVCKYTNERGDLVFGSAVGGEQEAFVSIAGERPVQLPAFAQNVNVTGEIGQSGVVPGLYLDARGRERAYVWSPQAGPVVLPLRAGLRQAAALFATADGTVWGLTGKRRRNDSIFVWNERDGLRLPVRGAMLRRLARRRGLALRLVKLESVNDVGAVVGRVIADDSTSVPFYYSVETGLVDLGRVVEALGVDFAPDIAFEVNNRGQVLLGGRTLGPPQRTTRAILSPVRG